MRLLALLIPAILVASPSLAEFPAPEKAISLEEGRDLMFDEVRDFRGTCGKGRITVSKVFDTFGGRFKTRSGGEVIIEVGERQRLVLGDRYLSDRNGLRCVKTATGDRLLLFSKCDGAWCGETYSFAVIDPDRAVLIAPKRLPPKGSCEAACASKLLGNDMPFRIDRREDIEQSVAPSPWPPR